MPSAAVAGSRYLRWGDTIATLGIVSLDITVGVRVPSVGLWPPAKRIVSGGRGLSKSDLIFSELNLHRCDACGLLEMADQNKPCLQLVLI